MSVRKCQLKPHNEVPVCTHFMAIIKETDDNKCWQRLREIWALICCWWGCKLVVSIGKRACQLFKFKVRLPGSPVVKDPAANSGDVGSILGPGRSHLPRGSGAHVPQLLSPRSRPCALQPGKPLQRGLCTAAREGPHPPQLEEACAQQWGPSARGTLCATLLMRNVRS